VDQCKKENGFGHDAIVDEKKREGINPSWLHMQFNDSGKNMT
jgi:hypothetical protein